MGKMALRPQSLSHDMDGTHVTGSVVLHLPALACVQVLNICSKKQIALKYVNCFPWVPESFSMCEALDEMGW